MTTFHVLIKIIRFRMIRAFYIRIYRLHDHIFDTHIKNTRLDDKLWLFADVNKLDITKINHEYAQELLRMWENHRFDLLGSGWVRCGFIDNAPGIESYRYSATTLVIDGEGKWLDKILAKKNVKNAKKIWKLITGDYQPIDWQKDYKSGFRWSVKTWYRNIKWTESPLGVDIKVPWELSRLQHLPRMAVFAQMFPESKKKITDEFQNQLLDFIAQNPPRMGVNWNCTMDVAIRVANMTLAYSLFCTDGCVFKDTFNKVFLSSVYEHCQHIFTNLEWSAYSRNNHYLANITGLLFGAAMLPPSIKQKKWLGYAKREVKKELIRQFNAEGSNFEGSTAYHRLSSDMVGYAMALISRIEKRSSIPEIADRLYGAAKFLEAVTRPDNNFVQVGDNDSGLFFHLSPTGKMLKAEEAKQLYASLSGYVPEQKEELYIDENMNDGRPTISALSGLFESDDFCSEKDQYPLEYSLVRVLCNGRTMQSGWKVPMVSPSTVLHSELEFHHKQEILSGGIPLLSGLKSIAFPAFGIFIFHSHNLYLLINASDNGQKGNGGHAHNDKLSFELMINGKMIFQDPGTFVYTALPELRNLYRSVNSHNTIQVGIEQNEYASLFGMKNQSRCTLLSISSNFICLITEYQGVIHMRELTIEDNKVIIFDCCNKQFDPRIKIHQTTVGYGKLIKVI